MRCRRPPTWHQALQPNEVTLAPCENCFTMALALFLLAGLAPSSALNRSYSDPWPFK